MGYTRDIYLTSLIFGSIFTILFGVSLSSLFYGLAKYGQCPYEQLLPQSLLVFGFILVSYYKVDDSGTHLYYFVYAIGIVIVYAISAIILACVIILTLHSKLSEYQSNNPIDSKSYYESSIYNYCYSFATTVIILTMIFSLLLTQIFSKKLYNFFKKLTT
ncbi:unnamed protein product [Adineta steineri]|uniref:Uncharacterized protein n=1 Tax=Adineta steineri TaxID=433720 RepID=A0A819EGW6_9BILA|nr:unnamed protein product [Adineta steineri]CAF3850424.1 unnamed protein product [Adineta steineri]